MRNVVLNMTNFVDYVIHIVVDVELAIYFAAIVLAAVTWNGGSIELGGQTKDTKNHVATGKRKEMLLTYL